KKDPKQGEFWPAAGAWVSKVLGPADKAVPAHLTLMYPTGEPRWGYPGTGGFLGLAHAPFRLVGGKDKKLAADSMSLKDITLERLSDRVALRKAFDEIDRSIDQSGVMDGMDAFSEQALGILTSSKLKDALDLSKEPAAVLDRYGTDDPAF